MHNLIPVPLVCYICMLAVVCSDSISVQKYLMLIEYERFYFATGVFLHIFMCMIIAMDLGNYQQMKL